MNIVKEVDFQSEAHRLVEIWKDGQKHAFSFWWRLFHDTTCVKGIGGMKVMFEDFRIVFSMHNNVFELEGSHTYPYLEEKELFDEVSSHEYSSHWDNEWDDVWEFSDNNKVLIAMDFAEDNILMFLNMENIEEGAHELHCERLLRFASAVYEYFPE